jgi:glycosyltransferase involved in cell wall biosynthesis
MGMRIAWLGPAGEGGGGPGLGSLLLECVLRQGAEVDFYTSLSRDDLPRSLSAYPKLRVVQEVNPWQWGQWYSRTPFLSFVSGTWARSRALNRSAKELIRRNRAEPYDCVFQWAFAELFVLGKHLHELPPVIVYPGVHSAGELRWHRRESAYARQSENPLMHAAVRAYLILRSRYQGGQLRKPTLVLGLSRRFNELLAEDYAVDPARMEVLYHPIATAAAGGRSPLPTRLPDPSRPMKLLFVARISVRKGLEQIVELSHRLDDLAGKVEIEVIGGRTQWSDYSKHLKDLNPRTAQYRGSLNHNEMARAYDSADILLMPSMYEPGGIVVGEALSRGLCLVVSDEVGSAEPVVADCCRRFHAGDIDTFERLTRELIDDLRGPDSERLRTLAQAEATRHFDPDTIGRQLISTLERVVIERRQSADTGRPLPTAPAQANLASEPTVPV